MSGTTTITFNGQAIYQALHSIKMNAPVLAVWGDRKWLLGMLQDRVGNFICLRLQQCGEKFGPVTLNYADFKNICKNRETLKMTMGDTISLVEKSSSFKVENFPYEGSAIIPTIFNAKDAHEINGFKFIAPQLKSLDENFCLELRKGEVACYVISGKFSAKFNVGKTKFTGNLVKKMAFSVLSSLEDDMSIAIDDNFIYFQNDRVFCRYLNIREGHFPDSIKHLLEGTKWRTWFKIRDLGGFANFVNSFPAAQDKIIVDSTKENLRCSWAGKGSMRATQEFNRAKVRENLVLTFSVKLFKQAVKTQTGKDLVVQVNAENSIIKMGDDNLVLLPTLYEK